MTEQLPYSYSITVGGSPTPTVAASGLPAWLTLNGNTLSGTPSAGDTGSSSTVTLTATNAAGSVDQSFQLTVQGLPSGSFDTASFEAIEFQ